MADETFDDAFRKAVEREKRDLQKRTWIPTRIKEALRPDKPKRK